MRTTHVAALAAILLSGTASVAPAADRGPIYTAAPAGAKCPRYDVSDIISSIDTNGDGVMTEAEWKAAGAPPSSFAMISKGSGKVTQKAFTDTAPPGNIDDNGDCKITLAEMKAMETKMPAGGGQPGPGAGAPPASAAPAAPPAPPAGGPGGGPPGSENNPPLDQTALFKALDLNGDGKVTAAEFATNGPAGTLFRDMDANHDGNLTQAELSASHPPAVVDANKDGIFSIDEFRATLKKNYGGNNGQGGGAPR